MSRSGLPRNPGLLARGEAEGGREFPPKMLLIVSPCSAELRFERPTDSHLPSSQGLSVVHLLASHQWTYNIPNVTDGVFYAAPTGSNRRSKTCIWGTSGLETETCAEERTQGLQVLGLPGPSREYQSKPPIIMSDPTSHSVKTKWKYPSRRRDPSPIPIMCYMGVMNRLASFISLACLLLQCSVCY